MYSKLAIKIEKLNCKLNEAKRNDRINICLVEFRQLTFKCNYCVSEMFANICLTSICLNQH